MSAIKLFLTDPAQVRKCIAAVISCAVLLVAAQVLPAGVGVWIQALTPLLVGYGVWQAPNADAP